MPSLIGTMFSSTFTSAEWVSSGKGHKLGSKSHDPSGNKWMFIKASAALVAGDCVRINSAYTGAGITIDTAKQAAMLGFAQVAFAADEYGWVQQDGKMLVRVAADCDVDLALYATATAGILDDATVSAMIQGISIESSASGAVTALTGVATNPSIARAVTLGAV